MRVLFVTSHYPPCDRGWGYMQLCEEVADGLAAKGHDIAVLTSTQRDGPEPKRPYPVLRLLTVEPDWDSGKSAAWQFFVGRRKREREAVDHLLRAVAQFCPQAILIWHAVGLPKVLLETGEQQSGVDVAYYLADYWPEFSDEYIAYWQSTPVRPFARLLKRPLRAVALTLLSHEGKPVQLRYENAMCVSDYVRQRLAAKGLMSQSAVVVHNGVDVNRFSPDMSEGPRGAPLSCLVAGRIIPEKGIHTVVQALTELRSEEDVVDRLGLTILGSGPPDYVREIQRKVIESGLEGCVQIQPPVPRDEMPGILRQHQVLILSSEYAEPIARSMQEAMAVGLLVIGTTTGGSSELLMHERTGLAFEAGNAQSLAQQLKQAVENPELVNALAAAGQARVRASFTIDQTIDGVEAYLQNMMEQLE